MLCIPFDSSFISTQFLALNLDGWFRAASNNFIIFWYPIIIYLYYINLRSSIIFYLSSGDIYLSLGISLWNPIFSSSFVIELFCGEFVETLVTLSAILLPIKLPVESAVFIIALFEAVSSASVVDCLAWSRSF